MVLIVKLTNSKKQIIMDGVDCQVNKQQKTNYYGVDCQVNKQQMTTINYLGNVSFRVDM